MSLRESVRETRHDRQYQNFYVHGTGTFWDLIIHGRLYALDWYFVGLLEQWNWYFLGFCFLGPDYPRLLFAWDWYFLGPDYPRTSKWMGLK